MTAVPAKTVMFAIPNKSGVLPAGTVVSIIDTMRELKKREWLSVLELHIGNALVCNARNQLAAAFLRSGCSDMFCIDDDMEWRPKDFIRVLESPHDFVCGMYRLKKAELEYNCHPIPESRDGRLLEARKVPVGFARLKRSVLASLVEEGIPRKSYAEGNELYKFFYEETIDGLDYGEDYLFCQMWRRFGGRIWIDPDCELTHWGTIGFKSTYAETFK